jgi:hypothetical protein
MISHFLLEMGASKEGVGAVLSQVQNGEEHPIAYFSALFSPAERNNPTTDQECLAIVSAIQHFRPYLYGK